MTDKRKQPTPLVRPDRRPPRTRQAISQALLDLLAARSYDQITIQDIVDRANVSRSTFYTHFQDKNGLLESSFGLMLSELANQIVPAEQGSEVRFDTALLFRHAQGHYDLYRTLIWGSGFEVLMRNAPDALCARIEERFTSLLTPDRPLPVPPAVLAYATAGTLLVLLKWWLDNKMPYTPEQMDEVFQRLMMPGINGLLQTHRRAGAAG